MLLRFVCPSGPAMWWSKWLLWWKRWTLLWWVFKLLLWLFLGISSLPGPLLVLIHILVFVAVIYCHITNYPPPHTPKLSDLWQSFALDYPSVGCLRYDWSRLDSAGVITQAVGPPELGSSQAGVRATSHGSFPYWTSGLATAVVETKERWPKIQVSS